MNSKYKVCIRGNSMSGLYETAVRGQTGHAIEHRLTERHGHTSCMTPVAEHFLESIATSQYLWKFHSCCLVAKPGSLLPPSLFSKPVAPSFI